MIRYISPDKAKEQMNNLGKERKSFLFAFDYELSKAFVIEEPLRQKEVLFSTPLGSNHSACCLKKDIPSLKAFPIDYSLYKQGFDKIKLSLLRGDSYLANYTVATPIKITHSLEEIFSYVNSPFKLCLPEEFVCFSPERFVRIENNSIYTHPMKGTIDASIPNAQKIILKDKKETAEHITIVDLLRNDIGMVAKEVEVLRFRYMDKITNSKGGSILQVSSEIKGSLQEDWKKDIGSIILRLLPAGSICGAPKESTLRAINRAEKKPRGFYSGVFGYFDGERLDSAVLIRFIEKKNEEYFFRSGGGITVNSQCKKEYEEVNQKIYLPL
ncbi:MAG: aminodeoxychorismate synthase component I [Bacteroidota bacterium]|nr:aminodeoxychorismate synthase component I [Bacteroidota bacterium]